MSKRAAKGGKDKILFFGGYARDYPRNSILRKGLVRVGAEVPELSLIHI